MIKIPQTLILLLAGALSAFQVLAQEAEIFNDESGRYGLKEPSGTILINPQFKAIYSPNYVEYVCDCGQLSGVYMVDNGSRVAIYSAKERKYLTGFEYDHISHPISTDDIAFVKKGNKTGLIRLYTGQLILPVEWDSIVYTHRYVAEWGLMRDYLIGTALEKKFVRVIKNNQCDLYDVTTGRLAFAGYKEGAVIFVHNGKESFPVKRTAIGPLTNGKAKVVHNKQVFYIDASGNRVKE